VKKLMQLIVAGSVFIAMPLAAEDQPQHSGQQSTGASPAAKAVPASKDGRVAMMATMKDNMDQMCKQLEQIRQTKDPNERERLIQDHIWLMTWQMEMMKRLPGAEMQQAEGANRDSGAMPSG
jgi:hypothetical protein